MSYTVGKYLVDRLEEIGLRHLFSIAGDYSIQWVNTHVEPSDIQVIYEVNELIGGYAADGYARLKGIGALCTTYSAGSLSATNAIAGAYVERVPVVLINGTPSIKDTLRYEQTGYSSHHFIGSRRSDMQVFEYITAAAVRIDNPDLAPMLIDYALTKCITEQQPVYIELLEDMVGLECESPRGKLKAARKIPDPAGVTEAVATIKAKLEAAAHPLIWVGVEVDRYDLKDRVEKLIKRLEIPYVTELLNKAILPEDDKWFAGVFDGQASSAEVQALAKNSDFILALGVWLTDINAVGWNPDFDNTAFVSWDTVKYGSYFVPQVPLADLVEGLLDAGVTCKDQDLPSPPGYVAPAVDLDAGITYQGFYDFIPDFIPKNSILGSDASLNYFGSILYKVGAKGSFIIQSSYSAIGYIAPAATGICLAEKDGRRVVMFSGDGGFQMTAQCLATQTRFGLNPIIFVINNGVYGVEQWLADASVLHDPSPKKRFYDSCYLQPWNYSKLADVFECEGWKVDTYRQLAAAVKSAVESKRKCPALIQVVVEQKSIPVNAGWKTN